MLTPNRAGTEQQLGTGPNKSPNQGYDEMCDGYLTADRAAWERDMAELKTRATAVADMGEHDDAATYEAFDRASRKLLVQPAPDLRGVISKLELLFAEEIASDHDAHDGHKTVIGDLRRAIAGCI
jgi:hypothetical protein